ncbi:hypothetical protein BDW66DRAFT_90480 [Aspergillus desertorum]
MFFCSQINAPGRWASDNFRPPVNLFEIVDPGSGLEPIPIPIPIPIPMPMKSSLSIAPESALLRPKIHRVTFQNPRCHKLTWHTPANADSPIPPCPEDNFRAPQYEVCSTPDKHSVWALYRLAGIGTASKPGLASDPVRVFKPSSLFYQGAPASRTISNDLSVLFHVEPRHRPTGSGRHYPEKAPYHAAAAIRAPSSFHPSRPRHAARHRQPVLGIAGPKTVPLLSRATRPAAPIPTSSRPSGREALVCGPVLASRRFATVDGTAVGRFARDYYQIAVGVSPTTPPF